jgi:hypothetical protein
MDCAERYMVSAELSCDIAAQKSPETGALGGAV